MINDGNGAPNRRLYIVDEVENGLERSICEIHDTERFGGGGGRHRAWLHGDPCGASSGSSLRLSQDAGGQVAVQQGATLRAGLVDVDITSAYTAADPETF